MNLVFRFLAVLVIAVTFDNAQQPDSTAAESAVMNQSTNNAEASTVESAEEPVVESPGLMLASQHLQELLPLLDHLRVKSPQRYEKAIRELDRSAKKLESIKRRDAKLFDISLREWQTRGHIDLLKAKLQVKHSDQDQQAMLQSLQSLHDAELERTHRELALIYERKLVCEERIRQTQQLLDRDGVQRKQLEEQRIRLETESIDEQSTVYLKAIGTNKNDPTRLTPSLKLKSKKATNEN